MHRNKGCIVIPFLLILVGVAFFGAAPSIADKYINKLTPTRATASTQARSLHSRLPSVADMHADPLCWGRSLNKRTKWGHVDVPRLIEGNVSVQVFSVFTQVPRTMNYTSTDPDALDLVSVMAVSQLWGPRAWRNKTERALYQAKRMRGMAEDSDGKLIVIETSTALREHLERRKTKRDTVAAVLSIEGMHAIENELDNVDVLFDAGYRMMGLTHFFDNEVAGSAHGVDKGGLTVLGRKAVERMQEKGIVVDLAHLSPNATNEVLAMATKPVVVSHGGVKATCPGNRNLSDTHLRKIADTGGVVGIGYWPGAICSKEPKAVAAAIRHVADTVGVEHVGYGSDFDGAIHTSFDTSQLDLLTQALMDEGFSEADIAMISGGNVVRLLLETLPE